MQDPISSNRCRTIRDEVETVQDVRYTSRLERASMKQLSCFLESPGQQLLKAVIRVLSYRKSARKYGINSDEKYRSRRTRTRSKAANSTINARFRNDADKWEGTDGIQVQILALGGTNLCIGGVHGFDPVYPRSA